jgi:hypothetical protein
MVHERQATAIVLTAAQQTELEGLARSTRTEYRLRQRARSVLHGKGQDDHRPLSTYVRDDRPFAGADPPAAIFYYSRNRNGEHPTRHLAGYDGILQADAYAGFGELYDGKRKPGPITVGAHKLTSLSG